MREFGSRYSHIWNTLYGKLQTDIFQEEGIGFEQLECVEFQTSQCRNAA